MGSMHSLNPDLLRPKSSASTSRFSIIIQLGSQSMHLTYVDGCAYTDKPDLLVRGQIGIFFKLPGNKQEIMSK